MIIEVVDDLYKTVEQCGAANWDGYGATPVTRETFMQACIFLEALPLGTTAPSVGAEPDGNLTLEWYRSPSRILSVSLSPEGELHYAALLGPGKIYGTEPFGGGSAWHYSGYNSSGSILSQRITRKELRVRNVKLGIE